MTYLKDYLNIILLKTNI